MLGLFRKSPNLACAVAAVNVERTARNQQALERALKESTLFLASAEVPTSWKGSVVLADAVSIPVMTSDAPGGGTALLCFTDTGEVRRRTGSDSCFGLDFKEVVSLVDRHGYAGIIINPAGPWAGVPAEQLKAIANAS